MTMTRPLAAFAALCLCAPAATAHDMWVNAFTAHDAEDGTTTVVTSMGWGHAPMPISEFLNGARLQTYAIVSPDGDVMPLPFDATANENTNMVPGDDALPGLERLQGGDAFVRRLDFSADAARGGWRAHAALPPGVYSTWTSASGERVSGARFADELAEGEEIVSSRVTVRSSDAYWAAGDWLPPQPADVPLQVIPQTDVTDLQAGDEVVVEVFRDGERIVAGEDATFLAISEDAEVEGTVGAEGELRVTLPSAGMWILRAGHDEPVAEAGAAYADFDGRIEAITFTGTVPVSVAP